MCVEGGKDVTALCVQHFAVQTVKFLPTVAFAFVRQSNVV